MTIPVATHRGELTIMGVCVRCYRLDNGQAVFDADDFNALLAVLFGDGDAPLTEEDAIKLARFMRGGAEVFEPTGAGTCSTI